MAESIELEKLLANNPNVNAEQLRERLEACKKLRPSKYNYNLIAPFAGRLHRRCAAEVGGSADNVRQKS